MNNQYYNYKKFPLRILSLQVTINPHYQLKEIAYCINKVKLKCLAMDLSYKSTNHYQIISTLISQILKTKPRNSFQTNEYHLTHLIVFTNDEIM